MFHQSALARMRKCAHSNLHAHQLSLSLVPALFGARFLHGATMSEAVGAEPGRGHFI